MRIRIKDPTARVFIWRFLNSRYARAFFRLKATGIAGNMPKINGKTLKALPVPLAPQNEQRRIVAKIEALQDRSRRAREALEAVPPLLEKFRQSVLAAAFRGDLTADWRAQNPDVEPASELLERIRVERRRRWEEAELAKMEAKGKVPKNDKWKAKYKEPAPPDTSELPELPSGWVWATVDQGVVEPLLNGRSVRTREDGFPVLRLTAIKNASIDLEEWKPGAWTEDEAQRYLVKSGDFLVSRGNGSRKLVGIGGLVQAPLKEAAFPDTMIRLRFPPAQLDLSFVATLWNSDVIRLQIESRAKTTAGIYKISQGDIRSIILPIPSLPEQVEIARKCSANLGQARILETLAKRVTRKGSDLNNAILQKAFQGKLVPQDPNDEPAADLIERIRREREAASPKKPARRRKKKAVAS